MPVEGAIERREASAGQLEVLGTGERLALRAGIGTLYLGEHACRDACKRSMRPLLRECILCEPEAEISYHACLPSLARAFWPS